MTDPQLPSKGNRLTAFLGVSVEVISILFISRLVVDTSARFFMPFLPEISSGLGLTVAGFSWILGVRSLIGLVSPMIGALADQRGRRLMMTLALGLRGLSLLGLTIFQGWWSLLPMLLLNLSAAAFYPVLRAYVSDLVRYQRRGRALAAVDASFPTAGIVGLPLVGWLIEIGSWKLPIVALAGLCLVNGLILTFSLPKTEIRSDHSRILRSIWTLSKQPKVLASIGVSTLLLNAFTLFTLFWAFLLNERFNFSPLQIGVTGTAIGIAELFGLLLAGMIVDRIGKRRGTLVGLLISLMFFVAFLLVRDSLNLILLLMILYTVSLEFAITSSIPLISEQVIENRATLFSLISFGNTIGEGIAPPLFTFLWTRGGTPAVVLMGSGLILLSLLLVKKFIFDSQESTQLKGIG